MIYISKKKFKIINHKKDNYRFYDLSVFSIKPKKNNTYIIIKYKNKCFIGNKKDILLEQLELQKIYVPYSCRSGICYICKIKLLSGNITLLTNNLKIKHPWILSCICIPYSNIELE